MRTIAVSFHRRDLNFFPATPKCKLRSVTYVYFPIIFHPIESEWKDLPYISPDRAHKLYVFMNDKIIYGKWDYAIV